YRAVVLVAFGGVLYATVAMFGIVPKGFIPDTDNDRLNVGLNAAQGTSFYEIVGYAQRVADIIRQSPYVEAEMANTGGQGGAGANFNLQLVPRGKRAVTAQQIAQQLR